MRYPFDLLELSNGNPFMRPSTDGRFLYSYRDDFLSLGTADNSATTHELAHFLAHCSTPYGLFLDFLHRLQMQLAQNFLEHCPQPIWVPVKNWATLYFDDASRRADVKFPDEFEALLTEYVEPWFLCGHLEQVLEVDRQRPAVVRTQHVAEAVLVEVERRLAHVIGFDGSPPSMCANLTSQDAPPWPAVSWQWNCPDPPEKVSLGAFQISEAIAQLLEGIHMGLIERRFLDYCVAFGVTVDEFRPECAEMLPTSDRRIAVTCHAVADLSLFTPIGPVYCSLRTPRTKWADIHPGYRFMHAIKKTAEIDGWIDNLEAAEKLCNRLCDELGWARPRKFLDIGASLQDAPMCRHRESCQLRRQDFSHVYRFRHFREGQDLHGFIDRHMPITYYGARGCTFLPYPPGADHFTPLRKLRDCFLSRLLYWIMLLPDGLSRFLPEALRYADLQIDNVTSDEEFVALIEERYPWSSFTRFRSL